MLGEIAGLCGFEKVEKYAEKFKIVQNCLTSYLLKVSFGQKRLLEEERICW
jgi:hypothetical protein